MADRKGLTVCPECGFDESTVQPDNFGLPLRTTLNDQYVVGRALGAGGFAITYLAWDLRLARRVAIKEYMPSGLASRAGNTSQVAPHSGQSRQDFQYGLEHFLDEAQMVARFQSYPGIIAVINYFPANGTAYLVMEYLEGGTLKQYLEGHGGRLPFNDALAVMTPVMDALRELHRADVLHRDISPDNIYITTSGQVKLLDFGAARQALRDRSQRLSVILKVGYAPEEQYRSAGNQGPWTDVYAVGATFYHVITGQIPPPSIDRLAEDTIAAPSALGAEIPPCAEEALMTALAVRAAQRYPTIQDFQAAIGLPAPSTRPERAISSTVRMRIRELPPWAKPAGAGAGLILALAIGFVVARSLIGGGSGGAGLKLAPPPPVPQMTANPIAKYIPPNSPYYRMPISIYHPGKIAPLESPWPPPNLRAITMKAIAEAQTWASDIELIEIKAKLDPNREPFYIQSKQGTFHLDFTFYSPSKQKAIMVMPNEPLNSGGVTGDIYPIGFVNWGSRQPIPLDFMELTDAVAQARQRGMKARVIKSATLANNPPGTSQGGANLSGLRWLIKSVFGNLYSINATQPPAPG